jgi:hypothetical protein
MYRSGLLGTVTPGIHASRDTCPSLNIVLLPCPYGVSVANESLRPFMASHDTCTSMYIVRCSKLFQTILSHP